MAKTKERSTKEVSFDGITLNFSKSPIVYEFVQNNDFVQGLMGPVGCVAPDTMIITEHGPMRICDIDRPMQVLSWNDKTCQFQLSWCGSSFQKGIDYLYRVVTPNGEFVAAANHLVLCEDGSYQQVQTLQAGRELKSCDTDPILTSLASSQHELHAGVPRLMQKSVDCLESYARSVRQYGQLLLSEEGIGQVFLPLLSGARKSTYPSYFSSALHRDAQSGQSLKHTQTGQSVYRKRIGCYIDQLLHLLKGVAGSYLTLPFQHNASIDQQSQQCQTKSEPRWLKKLSSLYSRSLVLSSPKRAILSIERMTVKESYWDLQVLDTNNYVTIDGAIHHNSGKSYACCAKIFIKALQQTASPIDNVRYSRFAVVRNSYPMLKTTTIKTWLDLFPEATFGPMLWTPPITHHIRLPAKGDAAGIDCEVIFLALDQPKDVRKLLSLELTGAWVNEARELPKAVIDGLTHRVGRYPSKRDGGAKWLGVFMDTNPMDDDHWWHRVAEKEKVTGNYAWTFFNQPGGVIEVDPGDLPDNPEANDHIFASGRWWKVNSKAENLDNLPAGYYPQMLGGKNLDWIRCYAEGKYTYVQEGRPVWPEYDDNLMCGDVEYDESLPLQIGVDFGLTPAAVLGQRLPNNRWVILHEIVTEDMGLERFGQQLLAELNAKYPKAQIMMWGDPAGMQRDAIYEVTAFDYLRTLGLRAQPTHSNDFKVRREGAAAPMQRLINGKPGLIVNRSCKMTRKSLAGGYHFKRVSIGAGHERFRDMPNKNEHSHVGDAFGYLMLGGGEHKRMTRSPLSSSKPIVARTVMTDFDVFNT